MADWHANNGYDNTLPMSINNHSRQSSQGSGHSGSSKENANDSSVDDSSLRMLILNEGDDLKGESRTEMTKSFYSENHLSVPSLPAKQLINHGTGYGTAKAKAAKSPFTAPPIETIPVEEFKIPNDGNISSFTSVQLANFLKCLKVEDKIISHLHRKSVDGKRFAKMNDSEFDTLGMNNPVILFFRNKSNVKNKTKGPFML